MHICRYLFVCALLSTSSLFAEETAVAAHAEAMTAGAALFQSDVAPLLTEHCVKCHGGEKGTKGGFDLSTRESALKEGDSGQEIIPGNSAESLLILSIRHADPDLKMPKKGDKLPEEAIAKIAQWVDLGAPFPKPLIAGHAARDKAKVSDQDRQFWSFQPLVNAEPPAVKDGSWCRTPIDRFILAKLEEKGVVPSGAADKRKLIRRAYFDLIGLPPTPEQVEHFLNDASAGAFETVVDELLASPHYGERWGRHWLDLARYAESHGYEQDYDRPNAWHYRDYIIRALNADQPYDQFLQWQIAGDELAPENPEAWKATGFLAAGTHATQITANQAEKERYDELDDMASTTGMVFLGLSVGCARCHDHKFDPIPTADYYRLISTFTTTVRSDYDIILNPAQYLPVKAQWDGEHAPLVEALATFEKDQLPARLATWEQNGGVAPELPPAPPESGGAVQAKPDAAAELAKQEILDAQRILKIPAAQRTPPDVAKLLVWYRQQDAEWQALAGPVAAHEQVEPKPEKVTALICSEGVKAVRLHTQGPDFYEKTFQLKRGDVNLKESEAAPGFLQVLSRADESRWHLAPPAGARTSMKRAALAHWLADVEFGAGSLAARVAVNRLWQHHFGRGLVSTPNDFGAQGERPSHPELLDWLASELIRGGWKLKPLHKQIMLSSVYQEGSATEDAQRAADPDNFLFSHHQRQRLEGEAIRDAILAVSGVLDRQLFGPGTLDEAMKRRSIYFQLKRSMLPPMMIAFDAPDTLQSMGLRSSTTVAPQSLLLLNNVQVRGAAKAWAARLATERLDPHAKIAKVFLEGIGRLPSENEEKSVEDFIATQSKSYAPQGTPEAAWGDLCQLIFGLNEFLYID